MHYLFAISTLRIPSVYYMLGANLGCISHGDVSVMYIKSVLTTDILCNTVSNNFKLQTHRPCKVILCILSKSPNILTRACNIAIVFLWSIIPITPRCLVCSEVVICNPGQSVVHIYEVLYSLKAHENSG